MKKRITGLLLALCLCLTLLPGTAGAAYEQQIVSAVSVSVTAPMAGADLTAPTVEASQPYYIADSSWTRVAAEGCTVNLDSWGSRSDTFKDNNWYLLCVKLLLDYGYTYGENVGVNGLTNATKTEVERYRDDTVYVSAWFKVGSPAGAANIDSISVSNVPTTHTGDVGSWTDAIENAVDEAIGNQNCKIYYAAIYTWNDNKDYWSVCTSSDTVDSSKVACGAGLIINTTQGHVFTNSTTVTINDKTAEIMERKADEIKVFVPFGTVSIGSVEVDSDTWPIEGNTINKNADNFSIDAEYMGCTLASAQFQVWDSSINGYRDLSENETEFREASGGYRVIAVLKAKDYATFANSVKGDFNGTSGVSCEVSDDGKTCTVTRTCKVYDPIYTYPAANPNQHINSITIYRNDPAAGQTYVDDRFSTDGQSIHLMGADETYSWYEVPYVGSTTNLKTLTKTDSFENGKVYLASMAVENRDGYRFGEGFTVSFKQLDGSNSNYAWMECTQDTAKSKQYNIWYTVGDVTQQAVTNVAITGPKLENGTIDTSDLSKFTATGGVTITSADYHYNSLHFTLKPQSGYYFGRTVTVAYNGKTANVSDYYHSDQRFDIKYASVDYTAAPAIPITVSGITAESKAYDGTTSAELDITKAVLSGVETGDDVTLDISSVKAVFANKNAGTWTVSVTGQFKLMGRDASKYKLTTQPTDLKLTASIIPCTDIEATNTIQTIYVGGSNFEAPKFTGVTVNGTPETVNGRVAYTLNGAAKTKEDIGKVLKTLKAGDTLTIGYSFTATDDNYKDATESGEIIVIVKDRPSSGGSSSPSYSITLPDKTEHGTVTANRRYAERGDTVTITVKPDSGYVLETLTATDRNGKELKLTDKGDGKYTFTMPSGKVEVKATFMEDNSVLNFFYDVPNDAYYYEAVKWAVGKGITTGIGDNLFAPGGTCTRAQAVTFLWRAAGSPEPKSIGIFSDVAAGSYYAKAVAWAIENGITNGTGEDRFSPDADCTRAQIATFLYRYMQSQGKGFTGNWMFQLPFTDVPEWCYEAVAWCYMEKVTDGTSTTTFSPNDDCTRAQIVTFLFRCMK